MSVKVAICFAAVISCALCVKLPIAFPGIIDCGAGKGDDSLPPTSNPVVDVDLAYPVKFFGEEYSRISISDNGFVSFGVRESSTSPKPFPIQSGPGVPFRLPFVAMAAGCWSNVDLRCGGEVFYRQKAAKPSTPDEDLEKIRGFVAESGQGPASTFQPKSAVIVTYLGVTPERASSAECMSGEEHPQNTYQIILTTDEISTYVIFIYEALEWSIGNGEGPATSGLNAGNRVDGITMTPEELSVYVYQVNLGQSFEVMVQLKAEMMMDYAVHSDFGVAEVESYPDLPMFEGYVKPRPKSHPSYYPAMTQEMGNCELFSYGTSSGDEYLWGSDTSTGIQYLDKPIHYYGETHNTVVAYINGYITFGEFYTSPFPPKELSKITVPSVCPYYADGDARGVGHGLLYWRETTNQFLLERAKTEINGAFGTNFDPDSLLIVTWDRLGYNYGHNELQNTFQAVIASNDEISYVLFLYKNMEWTSPDGCLSPSGDAVKGGLGADPDFLPIAGICDGGINHQGLLSKPRNQWSDQDYLQLPIKSGNTGLTGVFAFCASENSPGVSLQKSPYSAPSHKQSYAIDPKTSYVLQQAEAQHVNAHRPSRPYVSKQWRDDVEALASELGR